jgi:Flp pilus assembly protein CpaB
VVSRDLAAGHRLTGDDLREAHWPAASAPHGRGDSTSWLGHRLASSVRAGDIVTDARVLGPGLLAGQPPGTVAMPVRLADSAAALLVKAGDRVDVLVSRPGGSGDLLPDPVEPVPDPAGSVHPGTAIRSGARAERVVSAALVLAVPGGSGADGWNGAIGGRSGDGPAVGGSGGLGGGALGGLGIGPGAGSGGGSGGSDLPTDGAIVLAVSPAQAELLTAAQTGDYIGVAVLPRP